MEPKEVQTSAQTDGQEVLRESEKGTGPMARVVRAKAEDIREELPKDAWTFPEWSREYIDLIKRQCCSPLISDPEFAYFIEQCRRAELDPMRGEADCVPRRTKIKEGNFERWIEKWVFQPREVGMAARADRFPDFGGIKAAAIYENDRIEIDADSGKVQHIFSPVPRAKRGALVGAWAKVERTGRVLPVEIVWFEDYSQNNAMWQAKGETMIVKCCRMAAYRRAYPRTFGQCYAEEEMGNDILFPAVRLPAGAGVNDTPTAKPATALDAAKAKIQQAAQPTPQPTQGGPTAAPQQAAQAPATPGDKISALLDKAQLVGEMRQKAVKTAVGDKARKDLNDDDVGRVQQLLADWAAQSTLAKPAREPGEDADERPF